MNTDILQSLVRAVLNAGAGWLIAHGFLVAGASTTHAEEVIGGLIVTILTLVWSKKHQTVMINTPPPTTAIPNPQTQNK